MNNIEKYALTVLLGVISGTFGGGLGLGVTTLALPGWLILGLVPNTKTAIGTTLIASPASWPAVYEYYKKGYVKITLGIIYFIIYSIFSFVGATVNLLLSQIVINYLVSIVHFIIGFYFLYLAVYNKS
jgi:uncharacterized membrane protein YfcA